MKSTQDTSFGVRANVYIEIDGADKDPSFEAYVIDRQVDSGDVQPCFTRPVAEQVVAWANQVSEVNTDFPICEWSQEGYILVFTSDSRFRPSEVVQPDKDGLYALGLGWPWQSTEVEQ
ncbi:hypothetical protein [Amycolatopsis sp. CA-230715]|uniref:hypothetical protein n=1 Tax=Amycolatopsis sp. CA-230715 TaxID=2745196 RepID=UPI001C033239|nr:hypothetical protein [Amycolatopsis sp. CA-230715]QWF78666.1 hypothetical protein HUW46_02064 [Amycolatopsis sp. CA-230715]